MIHYNPAQEPDKDNVPEYQKYYDVYTELYKDVKETYTKLAKI